MRNMEQPFFTNKPYYKSLIWVMIDKRKKRESRLNDIRVSYEKVKFSQDRETHRMNEVPRKISRLSGKKITLPNEFTIINFL